MIRAGRLLLQVVLVSLFLALVPSTLFAGTFVAFGPTNYTRNTDAPVTVTNGFTVLDPTTTYTLRIDNTGVSSAVVMLNGAQVVGPSDFNANVTLIIKPVILLGSNQLSVQLRSAPGSSFSLQIIGVDNVPPVITATTTPSPNAAGWNNSNVTVSFTCWDKTSGVASCSAPVNVTAEGANQVITGTAIDRAGNVAATSITF